VRFLLAFVLFVSGLSWALPAVAATVNVSQGQVLLNRGDGYQRVTGSAQAGPGAKVVANPGGGGQILYPDECVVEIVAGTVYTIAEKSPCQTAGLSINGTTLAIGAAAAGGGLALGLLLGQGKPASP
jgi:hypothetical protein